jgi:hypothetical protein
MGNRWDATETRKAFGELYHTLQLILMPKLGFCKLIGQVKLMIKCSVYLVKKSTVASLDAHCCRRGLFAIIC